MSVTLEDVHVTSPRAGVSIVSFSGEHDLATSQLTSERLHSLLLANDLVVVDLSDAQYVDSSMLHVFIAADRTAREHSKDFRIQLGTESIVKRVFQISGALEHLTCASSRKEALNGSQPGAQDDSARGRDGAGA